MTEKKYKNEAWLRKQYTERHKSLESIAFECGCSRMTVFRWLLKFKIPVRDILKFELPGQEESRGSR